MLNRPEPAAAPSNPPQSNNPAPIETPPSEQNPEGKKKTKKRKASEALSSTTDTTQSSTDIQRSLRARTFSPPTNPISLNSPPPALTSHHALQSNSNGVVIINPVQEMLRLQILNRELIQQLAQYQARHEADMQIIGSQQVTIQQRDYHIACLTQQANSSPTNAYYSAMPSTNAYHLQPFPNMYTTNTTMVPVSSSRLPTTPTSLMFQPARLVHTVRFRFAEPAEPAPVTTTMSNRPN